jgi:hypothetical protein
MKLEKSDRRLLIWAGVLLLPMIVVVALLSQPEEETTIPISYSAQSKGAKAAFLLLQEIGYRVERWEESPISLPVNPDHTALVLAYPYVAPTSEEKNALQVYLSHGGKILFTGSTVGTFLPKAEIDLEPLPAPAWKNYPPQLLSPLTRGGDIQMSPAGYWKDQSIGTLAYYADEGRPIVVSYKVGKGEVIWWASSVPLTNAAISKSGNMALLLNSLGKPGERQILWDEYFHDAKSTSAGSYLGTPPIKYGLLQCLLVFVALIFTFSRRNGPIRPRPEPSRLSPLEFVQTLGKLYRRAKVVHSALEIPYVRFRAQVTRQLGISSDIRASELAKAVKNRFRYKDDFLEELLQQIETALHNPELPEAQALDLVQRLNQQAQRLKQISTERQENTTHASSVPGAHTRTN